MVVAEDHRVIEAVKRAGIGAEASGMLFLTQNAAAGARGLRAVWPG